MKYDYTTNSLYCPYTAQGWENVVIDYFADAFRGEARVHHVRCSADGAALCGEALKQTPSASQTRRIANLFRRKNGNRARASNEDITSKPGGGGAKTRYEVRSVERKMQRRKRSAKQLRPSGGTSFEQISQSSTKNIVASNLGPGQPDTKAYLSGHFKDNKKMSAHDQYLSETILSALKLILDKRNSFQNDSKALQLASVLLPKTVAEAHTKKARNQHNPESSTQSRRLPRQGMKFLIDLLSGANATNTTWNARKSNIVPNLVDPTQLGISILKLLFGHEAPLVTRPKYHTLFKKMSAASEAQHVRSDSKNSGQYHLPRAGTNFESLEARLGGQGMLSSANNVPTSSTLTTGDEMKVKGRQVLATNQRVMHGPTKSYIDVTGRRKSWVLLKIPKEDSDMETKGHKEADGDLAVTGKMRAPTTTVQVPGGAPAPAEGQKLKEAEEDISSPQHDDVDGDSISSKGEDMKTDMQHDQSSKITAKLIKTVKKFLGALQSSIEALQSNHQASREPQLEPKSSRPTAGVQLRYAKPTTARLAPANAASRALAREHDPLKEVPTQDEPITVPSPAAVGNRLALGDNVLFQSDAVIGTTRDTTDLAKLKEGKARVLIYCLFFFLIGQFIVGRQCMKVVGFRTEIESMAKIRRKAGVKVIQFKIHLQTSRLLPRRVWRHTIISAAPTTLPPCAGPTT